MSYPFACIGDIVDDITVTDLFCGGGGSTEGLLRIPGVSVTWAMNHSQVACDTHAANHPATKHDVANISQTDPRRYSRTMILWASPECTNQGRCKGKKRGHGEFTDGLFAADGTDEAAIRSRATMWDVPRFAEHHDYAAIIVENVPDARWWGPEQAPGAAFDQWVRTVRMWGGYEHEVIYLDSAHAQGYGPGSRSRRPRMYVVFWKPDKKKPRRRPDFAKFLSPPALCPVHGVVRARQAWKRTRTSSPERPWGVYGLKNGQYVYACPHHECGGQVIEPIVRAAWEALDLTVPAEKIGERRRPLVANTMRKIRAGWEKYRQTLLVPCGGTWNETAYPVSELMRTRTASDCEGVLIPPYMVELHGGGSSTRPVTEPLSTLTAGGINHGVVYPPGLAGQFELLPYYSQSHTVPVDEPMPTLTTKDRHGLLGYADSLEECHYRMLTVDECKVGMEFPDGYKLLGRDRDQNIELIGNAVTPNAARDIGAAVVEYLTGSELHLAA